MDIAARNAADHRLWFGWVESRMRNLLVCLDQAVEVRDGLLVAAFVSGLHT